MEGWLSEKEAQKYSNLSRTTLRDARNSAKLTYRQIGRKILYTANDLDSYIKENSQLFMSSQDFMKKGSI